MTEESKQDRTEEATPKRREEARKKGDVPRSRELTMTGVMIAGAGFIVLMSASTIGQVTEGFASAFSIERTNIFDPDYMAEALAAASTSAAWSMTPFAAVVLLAALATTSLIGGWSFSLQALAFKSERLSPIKGIKRIFSVNSLMELFKAMAKFLVVAVVSIAWLWLSMDELLTLGRQPVESAIVSAAKICGSALLATCASLTLIAGVDVPFQIWNYKKKLKMSRREIRDELKESEGRPEVKSKIRQLQQRVATRRMMEEVPAADVVITNPTHFAVALKYDEASPGAPRVVAKGKDLIASRIRNIAAQNDVAIFSAPPLARALYRSTDLGQEIPAALYKAVAQVLAYIFQLRDGHVTASSLRRPDPDIDESQF